MSETVETVSNSGCAINTPLKPGVNEMALGPITEVGETSFAGIVHVLSG